MEDEFVSRLFKNLIIKYTKQSLYCSLDMERKTKKSNKNRSLILVDSLLS